MANPDVLIIGGGPAGYACAIRLAQLGKRVVVVERDRLGGICLNRGCIPVKTLLHAASIVRNASEGRRLGLLFQAPNIDLVALFGHKARVVDRLVRGVEYLFKANGVELIHGEVKFTSPDQVTVTTADGEMNLTADRFVVATGSRPAALPGMEPDGKKVVDSDNALQMVELPNRLAIIGAGVIGLEFTTIFSRLGCKVVVFELLKQVLPGIDQDLVCIIERQMRREGVEFHLGTEVQEIARATPVRIKYLEGETEQILETDRVLVAAGRKPLSDEVGLDWAGVKTDKQGFIKVDSSFRTSAERTYAIGDVKGGPLLAHKAMAEGIALAEMLGSDGKRWKFRAVPFCVYTDPEVAMVGLSEQEAKAQGRKVKVSRVPLNAVGRSLTLGRSEGICKMVVDEASGRILGVGMVAPQADVLIAEAAVAVELGLTAEQVGRVVHPHPTMSELLFETARSISGKAIHIVNR